MVYLWKGDLPWLGLQYSIINELIIKIISERAEFDIKKIFGLEFEEISLIFDLIKKINFSDCPDHQIYRILLNNAIKKN